MCIIELELRNKKKTACCLLRDETDDRQIQGPLSTDDLGAQVNDPKSEKCDFADNFISEQARVAI